MPRDELKRRTLKSLSQAERLLTTSDVTDELESHGWSKRLMTSLAVRSAELRERVETDWHGPQGSWSGLSRQVLDDVSPKVQDNLKSAVYEADTYVLAWERRTKQD
jgi:hypothetical protein